MKTNGSWAVLLAALLLTYATTNAITLPVTWQALPFPTDSDWPGPQGTLATISTNEVILDGQPARTVETFSGRRKFVFDVSVEQRSADDGSFTLYFLPPGEPTDKNVNPFTSFHMIYRGAGASTGQDALMVQNESGVLWGEKPFVVAAGKQYHFVVNVSAAGRLTIKINGRSLRLPSTVILPYPSFQIQIGGWQPTNRWHVKNFSPS